MCEPSVTTYRAEPEVINLDDSNEDTNVSEAVLRYTYNFSYTEIQQANAIHCVGDHVQILGAARKYLLPNLEQDALTALSNKLKQQADRLTKSKKPMTLFKSVEYLLKHKNLHPGLEATAKNIARKHLAQLFKVARFRNVVLKRNDMKDISQLVIGAVEKGYRAPGDVSPL